MDTDFCKMKYKDFVELKKDYEDLYSNCFQEGLILPPYIKATKPKSKEGKDENKCWRCGNCINPHHSKNSDCPIPHHPKNSNCPAIEFYCYKCKDFGHTEEKCGDVNPMVPNPVYSTKKVWYEVEVQNNYERAISSLTSDPDRTAIKALIEKWTKK